MQGLSIAGSFKSRQENIFEGEIPEDWAQGRSAFGGLVVTVAVRALREKIEAYRRLRTVLVSFLAPISPGKVRMQTNLMRRGGSFTFTEARVFQEERLCTCVAAGFGISRKTLVQMDDPPMPRAPSPAEIEPLPFLPGIVPAFAQHFDYRWTSQTLPYSRSSLTEVQGWIRSRDEGRLDSAAVLSLIDAWPPPLITLFDKPHPLSSIHWQANLLRDLPDEGIDPGAFWFFDGRVIAASNGYADSVGHLWGPDGQLVATSRQLVAEFSGATLSSV